MIKLPAAITNESPGNTVRAVSNVPYSRNVPELIDAVSQMPKPWIAAEDENGPNVMATLLDALPAGEFAAPNCPDCRR
jgi:hypothetical protein